MNDKILTFLAVLCLAAIVGVMSWRDMYPANKGGSGPARLTEFTYDAGPDATAAMVPDDNFPVMIAQGEFKYTPDGKTTFIPEGMPPVTLAQRPVSLLLRLDSIPKDTEETFKKIGELEKAWENQGTRIGIVFLEYHSQNPDFKAYAAFLEAAGTRFKDSFRLGTTIDISWLEDPYKTGLQDLYNFATQFVVDLPQFPIPPELFSKLGRLNHAFILRFPAGTSPAAIDISAFRELKIFLAGYAFRLDAKTSWARKEEKVGLFPKF